MAAAKRAPTEYPVTGGPAFEPTHPGELLGDTVLPALKLSISEAADKLGVSRQALHRVLAGTAAMTPEMALRIGKLTGAGPTIWMGMQQQYDLWHAERRLAAELRKIPTLKAPG